MTLTEKLKALADGSVKRHPGEAQNIMRKAINDLEATSIIENAFKTGHTLPEIVLPNAKGELINLNEMISKNRVVLTFYRGGWCPYCNLELKALQEVLPQIEAKGAKLVAITPEMPDHSLTTKEKNELSFEVLSDKNNSVAKKMNLAYKLPNELVALYKTFNINLETSNGNLDNELPIAATYIIEKNGRISYHFLKEDYKLRADPETILSAL